MFRIFSKVCPESVVQGATAVYFKTNKLIKVGFGKFHSSQKVVTYNNMKVKILPANEDNYMYLVMDERSKEAAIVDPVDPTSVLSAVKDESANLTTVLTTHHHWDHAGGNVKLVNSFGSPLQVLGGDDRIGALTKKVSHGDVFSVGKLKIECLFTPCHTQGHICYHITDTETDDAAVFTGDTLFLGGCGRFFEGNAEEMHNALNNTLSSLNNNTSVYCGHEYALNNLAFGAHVEPENNVLRNKINWVKEQRQNGMPSVPSTIGEEKQINPFMRVSEASVQKHTKTDSPVETMRKLRAEKDKFKAPK